MFSGEHEDWKWIHVIELMWWRRTRGAPTSQPTNLVKGKGYKERKKSQTCDEIVWKKAWWHRGHPCWWQWDDNRAVSHCLGFYMFFHLSSFAFPSLSVSFSALGTHGQPRVLHKNEQKEPLLQVDSSVWKRWFGVYFWFKTGLFPTHTE